MYLDYPYFRMGGSERPDCPAWRSTVNRQGQGQDAVVKRRRRGTERQWWWWWWWWWRCWPAGAGRTSRRHRRGSRSRSRREQQPRCDSIARSRWRGSSSSSSSCTIRNDTSSCLRHIASRQHGSILLELELPGGIQALERQRCPQLPRPGQAPVPEAASDLQQLLGYVRAGVCWLLSVCTGARLS